MFGFQVRVLQGAQRLVVINPANVWLVASVAIVFCLVLINKLRVRPFARTSFLVWTVLGLVVFGFLLESARITLDRDTHSAKIKRFAFYHWTTTEVPLSEVDHAYLNTGAVSSRIVLQFTDGHVVSLSSNDQMGGKPEAVLAINQFLGRQ